MIVAHIKSPFGNRTEEWDDYRVAAAYKKFLVEFDAYVIGYEDDEGKEFLGVIDKAYWEVHEEVLAFYDNAGTYPNLISLTKIELSGIGANFRTYMALEKPFLDQANIEPGVLKEIPAQLTAISAANRSYGELTEVVVNGLPPEPPAHQPEATIYELLHALHDFTFLLQDSIDALQTVVENLDSRNEGEEYSSLDYLRELSLVRETIKNRQEEEGKLTAARQAFLALPASSSANDTL